MKEESEGKNIDEKSIRRWLEESSEGKDVRMLKKGERKKEGHESEEQESR